MIPLTVQILFFSSASPFRLLIPFHSHLPFSLLSPFFSFLSLHQPSVLFSPLFLILSSLFLSLPIQLSSSYLLGVWISHVMVEYMSAGKWLLYITCSLTPTCTILLITLRTFFTIFILHKYTVSSQKQNKTKSPEQPGTHIMANNLHKHRPLSMLFDQIVLATLLDNLPYKLFTQQSNSCNCCRGNQRTLIDQGLC